MMAFGQRMPVKPESHTIYDSGRLRIPLVFEFQEMVRYRFLIWNLIMRDLKVRYKRSILGFVWVTLSPLLQMGVLFVVFSDVFRFAIPHYAIYLLSGILAWSLYAQSTNAAMGNLQANSTILRKLYVPPSVFVVSAIGSALVNLVFSLAPFFLLAILNGLFPWFSWFYMIVPILLMSLFSLGIGLILSAVYVFFIDTFEIYQVVVNIYYFLTPIFYPLAYLPQPLRDLEQYNPMYMYIRHLRAAVLGPSIPPLDQLILPTLISFVVLLIGWTFFTHVEAKFVYHL